MPANEQVPEMGLTSDDSRLTIRHLFVVVTCVALFASFLQVSDVLYVDTIVFELIYSVTEGTALAGLVFAASRVLRGIPRFRNGGEWLWVVAGVQTVVWTISGVFVIAVRDPTDWEALFESSWMLEFMMWGAVYLYAFQSCRDRCWKLVFLLLPLARAISWYLMHDAYLMSISSMFVAASPDLLVVAVIILIASFEILRGRRLPWFHLVGLTVFASQSLVSYSHWLYSHLME